MSVAAPDLASITHNIEAVYARIDKAIEAAGRKHGDVTLELAVKTQTPEVCALAGQALKNLNLPIMLGQNRVQECVAMFDAVRSATPEADIHMIGPVQTNKINHALKCADLVETIDSIETADKFATRVRDREPLRVFVQVNTSGEETKSGCSPALAFDVASFVADNPNLHLEGFMTIGAHTTDEAAIRKSFADLRAIRDMCLASGHPGMRHARELSMGMSGDMELAIAEGATIVRVGTAVFGPRLPRT